jgi:predicted Zn-dependent peptidase
MKRIEVTHLESGLRVVSERLPQVESVAIGLWISTGLENEPEALTGISHYLEHMLFKGTARRNARRISEEIDIVGGHLNGYTDREHTALYVHLAGEHLPLAIDLLFDMALASVIDPEEVEKEREVIIQEDLRIEDNPEDQIHDLIIQAVWPEHPLGRVLQGNLDSIKRITREDLANYHKLNYRPERLLIAGAGALEHEELVRLVEKCTRDLKVGRPAKSSPPPIFHSGRSTVTRPVEQAQLCLALPGCAQTDPRRYAFAIYDTLLGGATSSRLFQEIRENRGLAYSIGSFPLSCRDAGLMFVNAGTAARSLPQVLELILLELTKLRCRGVEEEELLWVKSHVRGQIALARESTTYRMQRLAHALLYEGRVTSQTELLRRFEKVTLPELQEVAEAVVSEEPNIVIMEPQQ